MSFSFFRISIAYVREMSQNRSILSDCVKPNANRRLRRALNVMFLVLRRDRNGVAVFEKTRPLWSQVLYTIMHSYQLKFDRLILILLQLFIFQIYFTNLRVNIDTCSSNLCIMESYFKLNAIKK